MSIPIGNLLIEMAVNQARIRTDIEAARKTIDTGMGAIKKSAELAAKSLGALGIGLSVGMFAEWVRGAIDAADKMNDLSKSTGIAVQNLAGLKLAAKQSGGDLDGIAASINKLSVNIGNDAKKFELIGVTAKEPLEAFKQLADVFSAIQDPQLRAALGAEALGKSWASAAPLLAEGGDKIGAMVEKGKELANITPEVAQAADQLNDTLAEIGARSEGLKNQLMMALLPSLQRIADAMNETSFASKGLSLAIQGVGAIFDGLVFVGGTAINVLRTAGVEIKGIYDVLGAVTTGVIGGGFDGVKAAIDRTKASVAEIAAAQVAFRESFLPKAQDDEMARLINRQSEAVKRNSAAVEENARAFLKSNEVKKEGVDLYAKMIKQADDLVASIEFETKLLTMNNVEKETAIALQKLANMGIKEGTEEYKKYSEAIIAATLDKAQVQSIIDSNKRIEEARLDAIKKADEAQKKMEEDAAKQISDIGNQVGQSFADALMNGGKNAADYLKDLFRTLILRPIVQPVITGMVGMFTGGAASAMGGAVAEGAGGNLSSSLGLLDMGSKLKSAYDMLTGGFTSLGETVGNYAASIYGTLAIDTVAAAEGATALMASAGGEASAVAMAQIEAANAGTAAVGATASAAASAMAGMGAGVGLGMLISGDKSLIGGNSMYTVGGGVAAGAAIGSIVPGIGTAIGAVVGGIVGGLANQFGNAAKEVTDFGISGSLSSNGASVKQYSEWEKQGGWFGSDENGAEFSAVESRVSKYINASVAGSAIAVRQYADILGLPAKGISDFTFEIKRSMDGLSPEEATKALNELLAAYGNALASNVASEIGPFQRDGEEAGATLARLATSLQGVNNVFDTLNITLMDTSLYGADAASKLVDMFGGLDKFITATDAYYQAFYTEQERAAKTTEQLTAVFSQLGLSMPATNDAFRAMVESARAAGNDGLFAALIKLAPAFNTLTTTLSQSVDNAFAALQGAIQSEMQSAMAAIERQKSLAETARQVASESVDALRSIFDYLKGQISDILATVDTAQTSAQGMEFVRNALTNAQNTGYLPDQSLLSDAVSAARAGLSSENFATAYEMKRSSMLLAADLQQLQDIAGGQMTTAEQQLKVAEDQLALLTAQAEATQLHYDNQLQMAQNQINELRGINSGVLSLGDAMAAFAGVVNAARQAQAHPASVSQSAISMQAQIEGLYNSILGRGSDPIGLANWMQAAANGKSIDQIRQEFLNSAEYQSMPHFASGGAYPGGLAMVGERGPELINFGAPGQIYSSAQTSSILSGEQVASELRAMREEQAAQARSTAAINLRMTRIIERWEGSGMPETRVTT